MSCSFGSLSDGSLQFCCFMVEGGGAIEMAVSYFLREHSHTIAGKEQLLISAYAKALEVIPRQLCDNAGFDATNILNKLRQKHAQGEHVVQADNGNCSGKLPFMLPPKTTTKKQPAVQRPIDPCNP